MLNFKSIHKMYVNSENNIPLFIGMYLFLFFGICLFFYSSLYSLLFLFVVMVVFSPIMRFKFVRYPVLILVFIDLILIYGSKNFYDELGADLRIYYNIYSLLQYDPGSGLEFFGKSGEYGWGVVYYFIGKVFPSLNAIQLAITNVVISFFLIFLWIETKLIDKVSKNDIGIFYLFLFIFLNISMLGFLQRQALTLGFLLFALTARNNRNFVIFTLIACIFHLSSIVVAFFIFLSRWLNFDLKKIISIVFGAVIFRFILVIVASYIISVLGVSNITRKLLNFSESGFNITSLRYPILMLLIFFVSLINIKNIKNYKAEGLQSLFNFMMFSAIFLIIMMGVPLFADRIFMISLIIYGVYYYFFFYKKYNIFALLLCFLYLIVFFLEKTNLVGGLPFNDFYWARYPIFNEFLDLF